MEQLNPSSSTPYAEDSAVGLEREGSSENTCCVIDSLSHRTFGTLCFEEKRVVILNGKPTPILAELIIIKIVNNKRIDFKIYWCQMTDNEEVLPKRKRTDDLDPKQAICVFTMK